MDYIPLIISAWFGSIGFAFMLAMLVKPEPAQVETEV